MNIKLDERLSNKLIKIRDIKRRKQVLTKIGYNDSEIKEILEFIHIRTKAILKYPRASQMLFTKEGLEQASSKWLAEYRTLKIKQAFPSVQNVLEICSGIGGDTIALGLRWGVITVEKDPEIIKILSHNLKVYNLFEKVEIIEGDILELIDQNDFKDKLSNIDCIFFDPSRRYNSNHTIKIEEYRPSLSLLAKLLKITPNIVVKVAPAVNFSYIKFDCDIEVVSYKGSVKETMLWFGKFKKSDKPQIIATKLPENISMVKQDNIPIKVSRFPKKYIYEPDPAFIKAHVLNDIALKYNLFFLHEKIAFLTSDKALKTPMLKSYKYIYHCDMNFSKINKILKDYSIGRLDYKSRGVKIDFKTIHKSFEYHGKEQGLIIFTLILNQPHIILCKYI